MTSCAGECGTELSGRQRTWCADEACKKLAIKDQRLRKLYALTLDEYRTILEFQDGRCAICRRPPKSGKSLAVDHYHRDGASGPVRGLLCFFCNKRVVGARKPELIFATAEYLKSPPALDALGREVIAPGRPPKKRQPRKRKRK